MKLSVAMITYNHERFIAQALQSVLAQRVNFEYEIVIGEDCSTDGTRAIILQFKELYPKIIRLLKSDQNVGAMRNFERTILACHGQYIAFLEGDDYWTSIDKLQMQVNFLDAHIDRAICCHRVKYLNETGLAEADVFPSLPAGAYTLEDLLKRNFVMTCSTVLRRERIPPLPEWFCDMKLGDWPLFALVARHGKIELMHEIMAAYRVHSGASWSSLPSIIRMRESVPMLRALGEHLETKYAITIQESIAFLYLDMANAARFKGNRIEATKYLLQYVGNGGFRLPLNRFVAGLAAYTLIGSGYRVFSRANSTNQT
jgi:glycosyltransferase involved in cell wall biosynthesis